MRLPRATVVVAMCLAGLMGLAPTAVAWEVDEAATVTRIIDGDTFDATPVGRIRLADVDAPESYEPGYEDATDYLASLIGARSVYLDVDDVYGTDPYDRIVAVVYVRHNATHLRNVNEALLVGGVAVVSDYANEFDPGSWTEYVFYPEGSPPPDPGLPPSGASGPVGLESYVALALVVVVAVVVTVLRGHGPRRRRRRG